MRTNSSWRTVPERAVALRFSVCVPLAFVYAARADLTRSVDGTARREEQSIRGVALSNL